MPGSKLVAVKAAPATESGFTIITGMGTAPTVETQKTQSLYIPSYALPLAPFPAKCLDHQALLHQLARESQEPSHQALVGALRHLC